VRNNLINTLKAIAFITFCLFLTINNQNKAYAELGNDTSYVLNETVKDVGSSAKDGDVVYGNKNYGNNVNKNVNIQTVCGVDYSAGGSIRSLALGSYGRKVFNMSLTDKSALTDTFGSQNADAIYQAFINKSKSGGQYADGKVEAVVTLCNEKINIIGNFKYNNKFDYADIKIEPIKLQEANDDNGNALYTANPANYGNAICKKDSSGNKISPLNYQLETLNTDASTSGNTIQLNNLIHEYTSSDYNYRKKYDFGCAGQYKATYTVYNTDGTSTQETEIIPVTPDEIGEPPDIKKKKEGDLIGNSSLNITK
jgi:hypothetical protein